MDNHPKMLSTKKGQTDIIKWLWICLGVITAVFVAINVFKVPVGNLLFVGVLLVCPLLHIVTMKGEGHKH